MAIDTSPHKSFGFNWLSISLSVNAVLLLSLLSQRHQSSRYFDASVNALCSTSSSLATLPLDELQTPPCSGHGFLLRGSDSGLPACKCHRCFRGDSCAHFEPTCTIDLDHGDPIMFEEYWRKHSASATTVIFGWQRLSYFAEGENICWFLDHKLANSIRSLHALAGNALTDGRHLVVGTGSTQLFQAALYALAPQDGSSPTTVVCAAPFYSSYPLVTDYLKSSIYQWGGDAMIFDRKSVTNDNYIELVTSPNNPDGGVRRAVVEGNGPVVHDLAYYWPHYTSITEVADHEIMLFTVSKSTGHAGTRLGWAIVKDPVVARKMTKFVELNTIGVSQDAQLRAAQVLQAVVRSYDRKQISDQRFFHHSSSVLEYRWTKLRSVVAVSDTFSLPEFEPRFCKFFAKSRMPLPAFAWLRCNHATDCQKFLEENGIIVRSGIYFGSDRQQVRMSMLDRSELFDLLLDRLAAMQQQMASQ